MQFLVIALPVGVYSAVRQDTAGDYVGRSVAIFELATPNSRLLVRVAQGEDVVNWR